MDSLEYLTKSLEEYRLKMQAVEDIVSTMKKGVVSQDKTKELPTQDKSTDEVPEIITMCNDYMNTDGGKALLPHIELLVSYITKRLNKEDTTVENKD